MEEIWKPVKGYEDLYEVSNLGRVRSFDRLYRIERDKYHGEIKKKGRVISGNHGGKHYYQVFLFREGKGKTALVHRLVAEAFIPNPENNPQVNHKDGDKHNNKVTNLEWVTCSENQLHSFKTGLHPGNGEGNVNAKLTKEKVAEIRRLYVKGSKEFGVKPLARKFGVSAPAVTSIVKGRTWKGVS